VRIINNGFITISIIFFLYKIKNHEFPKN